MGGLLTPPSPEEHIGHIYGGAANDPVRLVEDALKSAGWQGSPITLTFRGKDYEIRPRMNWDEVVIIVNRMKASPLGDWRAGKSCLLYAQHDPYQQNWSQEISDYPMPITYPLKR